MLPSPKYDSSICYIMLTLPTPDKLAPSLASPQKSMTSKVSFGQCAIYMMIMM